MNLLRLVALMLGDQPMAAEVYTQLADQPFFAERTRYLNLGYWDGALNHDEAGDALAEQLGLAANIGEGDTLLDVGFGFGDQDDYWLRRFRPGRIVGLNVTSVHVERARERFRDPRLEFRLGSATAIDLADASVDRVTALECAFHFRTREDFFREAFRVLRPGGCCATADVLPLPGRHPPAARLFARACRAFWQVPRENWYDAAAYRDKLAGSGFADVRVVSIRERVYRPFWEAARRFVHTPAGRKRLGLPGRLAVRLPLRWLEGGFDYVIASARKPHVRGRAAVDAS